MILSIKSVLRHAAKGPFGELRRHLDREALERGFAELPPPPKDRGTLAFIVERGSGSRRSTPDRVHLTPEEGVPGDLWKTDAPESPEMQIAVMRVDLARLFANGQLLTLFGDQLFLDLDLSSANLPPGSELRVGEAKLVVTPEPHNGCIKFRQRFGSDALRLSADKRFRDQHLRGIYLRVLEAGEIAIGDSVHVLSRPGDAV